MYINIPGIRIHRGITNGYRCPISGREFASEDGSKSTDDRLRQEQEQHTQQIQHDMDLWRPSDQRTADIYKNQYAEFLAAAGDDAARQLAADQDTAQQEESDRDAARQEANRKAIVNKGQK